MRNTGGHHCQNGCRNVTARWSKGVQDALSLRDITSLDHVHPQPQPATERHFVGAGGFSQPHSPVMSQPFSKISINSTQRRLMRTVASVAGSPSRRAMSTAGRLSTRRRSAAWGE